MASRAEIERLNRILNSEEYGPKLVRLNRGDQRAILDLISEGDTRRARTEILARNEARLNRRPKIPTPQAVAGPWAEPGNVAAYHSAKYRPDRVFDLGKFLATAEREGEPKDRAHFDALKRSEAAMIEEARRAAAANEVWSVFWYHYWR